MFPIRVGQRPTDHRDSTNPLCDTKTVSTESSAPYEFPVCRLVRVQEPLLVRYFQLAASVTTSISPTSYEAC